ncbi:hypothetical protein [Catelliglobosispora koreensis]|uniref:hypothetical protein n=1 Tax=Catelliglobosispora koreensis TaxID=129052 RepID=UPI0003679A3B|nr:hypothetical protein [Catelliglobosispora koreensis]
MTGHINDDLLQHVMDARNPAYGKEVPPPTLTPEQMRVVAEARGRLRKPWYAISFTRRLALTGGAAGIVATVATVYFGASSPAYAGPGRLDMDTAEPATPAASHLQDLIRAVRQQPDATVNGGTTYVHRQEWTADTIHPDGFVANDVKLWWHQDRSGKELQTALPPQTPGSKTVQYLDALPSGSQTVPIMYGPGEFSDLLNGTPSADAGQLESQLDKHQPRSNGPQAILRALADVSRIHYLRVGQRVAVLTVLAGIPGLAWRGIVTDRAGRLCYAVSLDSGGAETGRTSDVLLISVAGQICGFESIAVEPAPNSPVPPNSVVEYWLTLRLQVSD